MAEQQARPKYVPRHVAIQIAKAVPAYLGTVLKVLKGEPVRVGVGDRIKEELIRRELRTRADFGWD